MSMYLSVHLDVVDAPHLTIGARRRRGDSRVSVSGQARDGGTRGVNKNAIKIISLQYELVAQLVEHRTLTTKLIFILIGIKKLKI